MQLIVKICPIIFLQGFICKVTRNTYICIMTYAPHMFGLIMCLRVNTCIAKCEFEHK